MATQYPPKSKIWHSGHYILACTLGIWAWIGIRATPWAEIAERYWARSIELDARTAAGRTPPLDERIKIFIVPPLAQEDSGFKVSAELLQEILSQQPRVLFIDHELIDDKNAAALRARPVEPAQTILLTSGFLARDSAEDLAKLRVPAEKLVESKVLESFGSIIEQEEQIFSNLYANQAPFLRTGYLDVAEFGYFAPVRKVGPKHVAFHAGILGGSHYVFYDDALEIDQGDLYPSSDLLIPIDLPNVQDLKQRTKNLVDINNAVDSHALIKAGIRKNDYVILAVARPVTAAYLPRAMSREQVIAAGFNAQLRKTWARESPGAWLLIGFAAIMGTLVASSTLGIGRIISLAAVGMAWVLFGLIAFSLRGISIPWLITSLAALTTGGAITLMQVYQRRLYQKRLAEGIAGKVSPATAASLVKRAPVLTPAPSQHVTLLSLDVHVMPLEGVVPSLDALQEYRRDVISELKNRLWEHKAIIFGSYDNHILVVFGATIEGGYSEGKHYCQAFDAALAIQRHLIEVTLKNDKLSVFATIGMETVLARVGMLDLEQPFEFGIISDASSSPEQLRIGCNRYRMMLGPRISQLLPSQSLEKFMYVTKFARLGSGLDLSACREVTPASQASDLARLRTAESLCSYSLQRIRQGNRMRVSDPSLLIWQGEGAEGQIINYSTNGLLVRMNKYYAHATSLSFALRSPDGAIDNLMVHSGIQPLAAQVRWAQEDGDGHFLHGLQFDRELGQGDRDLLAAIMTTYLGSFEQVTTRGA